MGRIVYTNMTPEYLARLTTSRPEIHKQTHEWLLSQGWKWDGMDGYYWNGPGNPPPTGDFLSIRR